MEIQVVLNPHAPNYGQLQSEMTAEIMALQGAGVIVTTKTAPPPVDTLG